MRRWRRFMVSLLAAYTVAGWLTDPLPLPDDVRTLLRFGAFMGTACVFYFYALGGDGEESK